ncbi:hypothetical protein SAMN05444487_101234 [Marininema mesophilum]|uniref:DUF2197 domain-containing protein n=1 Tax=Marininema mesophilum TaxID=1048340 RepID=A0A1H2QKS7_9BACL|nr:DUF2197 domain-containing protein [Marininema mesophilum]SDW07009.1 hypothetical protein SAMN05444487_101234 [Marininema mesophilum]
MTVTCILCEDSFVPTSIQAKKIRKHPHRIFLCPACHERVAKKAKESPHLIQVKPSLPHL